MILFRNRIKNKIKNIQKIFKKIIKNNNYDLEIKYENISYLHIFYISNKRIILPLYFTNTLLKMYSNDMIEILLNKKIKELI